jgi:hypothetical protein
MVFISILKSSLSTLGFIIVFFYYVYAKVTGQDPLAYIQQKQEIDTHNENVSHVDHNQEQEHLDYTKSIAQSQLSRFEELSQQYPETSYVKIAWSLPQGGAEHIWAHLDEIKTDTYVVTLENKPVDESIPEGATGEIPKEQVDDWIVRKENDMTHGGFSSQYLILRDGMIDKTEQLAYQYFEDKIEEDLRTRLGYKTIHRE